MYCKQIEVVPDYISCMFVCVRACACVCVCVCVRACWTAGMKTVTEDRHTRRQYVACVIGIHWLNSMHILAL